MNNENTDIKKDITIERKIEKYIQFFKNTSSNCSKVCSKATSTDLQKLKLYLKELHIGSKIHSDICCTWITR
jgi:hypothetical protein